MKILITGASGLLGWNVAGRAQDEHDILGTWLHNRPPLGQAARVDLTKRHATSAMFREFQPQAVIHTAAMTHADLCEKDPASARALNVEATAHLAQLCEGSGARIIYISTDLVFDGKKGMYTEADEASPISRYGETKLLAEIEVARTLENHVILRASLMYGKSLSGRRAADEAILTAQKEGRTLRLFTDEFRTPVCVPGLVDVILRLADNDTTGLYHCAGSERVSRYEFAQRLAEYVPLEMDKIIPARIADIPVIPPRAPDVSLDTAKLRETLSVKLPDLDEGLSLLHFKNRS